MNVTYQPKIKVLVITFTLLMGNSVFAQTAEDIAFNMKIESIDFVEAFNESNNNLGHPKQYIEKVSWPDKRIDPNFDSEGIYDTEIDPTECKRGTIEKFKNTSDLNRRYSYIKNVYLTALYLNQYMYRKGLFLMRLDKEFTPTQAQQYEREFNRVIRMN